MKAIREVSGQDLQWSSKKVGLFAKDEFELRSGDGVLAMVHAREKGTDWTYGEAADGRWALQSRNIGSGEILVITELDSQAAIAVVKRGRKHGIFQRDNDYIEFLDGRLLMWKKASTWHDEWDWADSEGRPLVHFQRHHVVIEPLVRSLPELSLLVIVGWQLIQLQQEARKKAAVAGVATATGSHVVVSH